MSLSNVISVQCKSHHTSFLSQEQPSSLTAQQAAHPKEKTIGSYVELCCRVSTEGTRGNQIPVRSRYHGRLFEGDWEPLLREALLTTIAAVHFPHALFLFSAGHPLHLIMPSYMQSVPSLHAIAILIFDCLGGETQT